MYFQSRQATVPRVAAKTPSAKAAAKPKHSKPDGAKKPNGSVVQKVAAVPPVKAAGVLKAKKSVVPKGEVTALRAKLTPAKPAASSTVKRDVRRAAEGDRGANGSGSSGE